MNENLRKIITAAVFAALACAATMLIQIPTLTKGYVNLGDCVVLIAGWVCGAQWGFAAAGIGSALADIISGYALFAPGTFAVKGLMAVLAALIAAAFKHDAPQHRGWLGVGDDCAMFDGWLVTKDLSVENTHFRLDWSSPEQAVEKHIVSNVSDISSMGGTPKLALLGLCINKNWSEETCIRVRQALSQGFAKRGIALIGGDTVSGDVGMFSTTLLGVLEADADSPNGKTSLLRSAVRPGDNLYVNGTLGKSGAGLWLLMNHPEVAEDFPMLVEYHLSPKIAEGAGLPGDFLRN